MEVLLNFVLSVVGSLIATLIIVLTATWRSKNVRRALTAAASAFLKVEVRYVFKNSREAENVIKEALDKATEVRIFTSRGNQFQRESYSAILQKSNQKKRITKILLPNPNKASNTSDWIDQREYELSLIDRAFRKGILRQQIKNTIEFLNPFIQPGYFEVRIYDAPHIGRIILTEEFLFLQPYKETLHGRDCAVTQYGRGDMYDMFSRYFDIQWDKSEVIVPVVVTP